MSYARRIILLAAWAAALVPVVAQGQRSLAVSPAPAPAPRIALVIGNAAYVDLPLRNPVNDARDMAQVLTELGFKVTLRQNADLRTMKQAIRQFGSAIRQGGIGLFYFSGHGVQSKGRNYLIPIGADIQHEYELEDQALDTNLVLGSMEEAQNQVNIIILDACRNTPFARSFRSVARGLAQIDAVKGSYVAFATAPGSVAADGEGRNGTYTKHLLASLRDSESRIEDVFQRVRASVVRESDGRQVPWESSSLIGRFYFRAQQGEQVAAFVSDPPRLPPDAATIELAFWESIKNSSNPADFQEYLRQYPAGRFAGLARNRAGVAVPAIQAPAANPSVGLAAADVALAARPGVTLGQMRGKVGLLVGLHHSDKSRAEATVRAIKAELGESTIVIPFKSFDAAVSNFADGNVQVLYGRVGDLRPVIESGKAEIVTVIGRGR